MPLHGITVALFVSISGLLTGVYKVIILFEDGVKTQGL